MTTLFTYETGWLKGKNGTTGDYKFRAVLELNSQDTQNNTSNVTARLELMGESNSGTLMWSANAASNQPYGTLSGVLPATGNGIARYYKSTTPIVVVTYTADIPHDADGTKTISETFGWVAGGLNFYPATQTIATATNIALPTIPRASNISVENALITDSTGSLSYTITAAATFYHKVEMNFNGYSATILNGQQVSSTYTGTIAYSDLLTWLGADTSATLELTLYTYSDSHMTTLVGTKSATSTVVNGVSPQPSTFIKGSMYPRLFPADATDFSTNGITTLMDTISCVVTEERNGAFTLEMVVATTTPYFDQIQIGCLILAKPNHNQSPQAFEIYEISKPINQKVTLRANHISYRTSFIPVTPFTATGITDTIIGLNANSQEYNPFIISTDIANETSTYNQTEPATLRSRLGGSAGSLLDTFGGEYLWDNFSISLRKNRGADNGVQLRLGKNILALEQTLSFDRVITGALPVWKGENTTVYGDVQHSAAAGNFAYARTIVLDLSDKFENQPTVAQLNSAANTYISNNNYATPSDNIKVSFVDLADTTEYRDSPLERVNLCDTVAITYEALGISYTAKVIKIVYDALTDRTIEAEVGQARKTLAQTIIDLRG